MVDCYYRDKQIRQSDVLAQLASLTSKSMCWKWTDKHQRAYNEINGKSCSATIKPRLFNPFDIYTDACKLQLGIFICQEKKLACDLVLCSTLYTRLDQNRCNNLTTTLVSQALGKKLLELIHQNCSSGAIYQRFKVSNKKYVHLRNEAEPWDRLFVDFSIGPYALIGP